ncbi:MAG: bacteriochlorophyll 4-vinyl reductase [Clostridium sp.]
MSENNNGEKFDDLLTNIMKVPGIKVARMSFLENTFSKKYYGEKLKKIIDVGPVKAGISKSEIDSEASKVINKMTIGSSSASFIAGLPGGIAMAATIPADIIQFFSVALRLAQELAYLYGMDDIWKEDILYDDNLDARKQFILYLGTMFGASGAAQGVRIISANLSKQVAKTLPQKALTKGLIYPLVKQLAKFLGIKMTKDTFAKSISKAIPIIGGVISGGITFVSMKPMGNRLKKVLSQASFNYTSEDYQKDIEDLKNISNIDIMDEIKDVEYEDVKKSSTEEKYSSEKLTIEVASELINKYHNLLINGALTQIEFDLMKKEILSKIM